MLFRSQGRGRGPDRLRPPRRDGGHSLGAVPALNVAEEKGTGSGRYAVALLLGLVRRLPQRLAVALGGLLGRLLWALSWRKVDRGEARCVAALEVGITVARGIVRRSFVNLGRSAVEFVRLDRMMSGLRETVTVEGRENLDRALARGRGGPAYGCPYWQLGARRGAPGPGGKIGRAHV